MNKINKINIDEIESANIKTEIICDAVRNIRRIDIKLNEFDLLFMLYEKYEQFYDKQKLRSFLDKNILQIKSNTMLIKLLFNTIKKQFNENERHYITTMSNSNCFFYLKQLKLNTNMIFIKKIKKNKNYNIDKNNIKTYLRALIAYEKREYHIAIKYNTLATCEKKELEMIYKKFYFFNVFEVIKK